MISEQVIEDARHIGESHGKSAASWTIDGNTSRETVVKVVKGLDDGDPEVYDSFNEPSFSGEWADSYTERDLCRDVDVDYDTTATEDIDAIADAWLESAQSAFWWEVERLYRRAL
jgi:hypothetical protein